MKRQGTFGFRPRHWAHVPLAAAIALAAPFWAARAAAQPPSTFPGPANPSANLAQGDKTGSIGTTPAQPTVPPDTVQTIEPRSTAGVAADRPRTSADQGVRIDAGGWAKERVDYFPMESPHPSAGRNDYALRTDLLVRARYVRNRQIEVNASGSVTHTIFHGQNDYRGSFDPELREASVGVFTDNLDFRFGQQRLAWGVTDFLSPNDILNARDQRDPFLGEDELRFIPTPMIRADWSVGIVTFQAVYGPWFVPDRYDVYGTNWAGIQPSADAGLQALAARTLGGYDSSLFDRVQRLYQQTSLPSPDYTEPSAGAQLSINGEGFDLHFYYHYGFDGPYVTLDLPNSQVSATYIRRHHVGMAMAVPAGPIVFRLEGAYQSQRAYFRADLQSYKSPAVETASAIEWETGDPAKVALLELYYQRIFNPPDVPLLAWEQDSYGAAFSLRWPIVGVLRTDSRIMASAAPETVVGKADLELNFDEWIVGAGYLGVAGREPSFGWYFRKNSEVFAFLKCLF